jgi:hypothetical protein
MALHPGDGSRTISIDATGNITYSHAAPVGAAFTAINAVLSGGDSLQSGARRFRVPRRQFCAAGLGGKESDRSGPG